MDVLLNVLGSRRLSKTGRRVEAVGLGSNVRVAALNTHFCALAASALARAASSSSVGSRPNRCLIFSLIFMRTSLGRSQTIPTSGVNSGTLAQPGVLPPGTAEWSAVGASTYLRRRMVPVVLLAAAILVAGCGSQQASPLSVAETAQVFAVAGIRLRPPSLRDNTLITPGVKERDPPAAELIGGSGSSSFVFVFVFRTVADAVHRSLAANPRLPVTRVQNVVILAARVEGDGAVVGPRDPRLRAAIRHL